MKKGSIKIILFSILLILMSCSTMQYNINKNNKFTEKHISNLLQKNGNVFYLFSTYSTFSIVWTYNKNGIEIYRLAKGKVFRKEIFSEKEWIQDVKISVEDINNELYKTCSVVLDGDGFGFKINIDGIIHEDRFAIDIDCMKQQTYKSDFLNKIVYDIKTCKMWGVYAGQTH